jgi:hypothetical protein
MNFPLYRIMRRPDLVRHYKFLNLHECHVVSQETGTPGETHFSVAIIQNTARIDWLLEHPLMSATTAEAFEVAWQCHQQAVHQVKH